MKLVGQQARLHHTQTNLLHRMVPDTRGKTNLDRTGRGNEVGIALLLKTGYFYREIRRKCLWQDKPKNNNTYDINELQTFNLSFLNLWLGKKRKPKGKTHPFGHTWQDAILIRTVCTLSLPLRLICLTSLITWYTRPDSRLN